MHINFCHFRAEMKHRMGYNNGDNGMFNYYRRTPTIPPMELIQNFDAKRQQFLKHRLISPEIKETVYILYYPRVFSKESEVKAYGRKEEPTTTPRAIVDRRLPEAAEALSSLTSRQTNSNSNSIELEPSSGLLSGENSPRDARLTFLRNILQKIRKHAEQMGFDGTMQISVIEVEPQQVEGGENNMAGKQQRIPTAQQQHDLFSLGGGGGFPLAPLAENKVILEFRIIDGSVNKKELSIE